MGFKEKIKDFAGNALIKGGKLKDSASVKAKELSAKAKLKTDLLKYNSELKKLYTDLGSLYYCLNKETPQAELKQTCEGISGLLAKIAKAEEDLKSYDFAEGTEPAVSAEESLTANEPSSVKAESSLTVSDTEE